MRISWTESETADLIEIWGQPELRDRIEDKKCNNKSGIFQIVSERLSRLGYETRTAAQIQTKIKGLRAQYKIIKDQLRKSGTGSEKIKTFKYFHQVDDILGHRPNITPPEGTLGESHRGRRGPASQQQQTTSSTMATPPPRSTTTSTSTTSSSGRPSRPSSSVSSFRPISTTTTTPSTTSTTTTTWPSSSRSSSRPRSTTSTSSITASRPSTGSSQQEIEPESDNEQTYSFSPSVVSTPSRSPSCSLSNEVEGTRQGMMYGLESWYGTIADINNSVENEEHEMRPEEEADLEREVEADFEGEEEVEAYFEREEEELDTEPVPEQEVVQPTAPKRRKLPEGSKKDRTVDALAKKYKEMADQNWRKLSSLHERIRKEDDEDKKEERELLRNVAESVEKERAEKREYERKILEEKRAMREAMERDSRSRDAVMMRMLDFLERSHPQPNQHQQPYPSTSLHPSFHQQWQQM